MGELKKKSEQEKFDLKILHEKQLEEQRESEFKQRYNYDLERLSQKGEQELSKLNQQLNSWKPQIN